jgi:hypothetical protein
VIVCVPMEFFLLFSIVKNYHCISPGTRANALSFRLYVFCISQKTTFLLTDGIKKHFYDVLI